MDLAAVMTEVSGRLQAVGLRSYPYLPDDIAPPAAVIVSPETYTFDATYGRGQDSITLPVLVLIAKVDDRAAWKAIAAYCSGDGAKSVKQAIDGDRRSGYTAMDYAVVRSITFDAVKWAGNDYISALFTVDIEGPGTA